MDQQQPHEPSDGTPSSATIVTVEAHPERRLIRPSGSRRHVDFLVRAKAAPAQPEQSRPSLHLALVLDRSGSMQGEKLETARLATLAVLERLTEQDQVAVITFDSEVEVLQPAAPASSDTKARVRSALAGVQARASTALHEGWLTGCRTIAGDVPAGADGALARVFLLTDGIANVGVTDAEQIASQAADVRRTTGIGTSTFGIGRDYDERLLAPLAEAGGGQFHHLRSPDEISRTFIGELGDLRQVVASQVRVEFIPDPGVDCEMISQYRAQPPDPGEPWRVVVGDLLGDDERHLVVRFSFPTQGSREALGVRSRVCWREATGERSTPWQELRFSFASQSACDDEPRDPAVMRWVGVQHAERTRRDAAEASRQGDPRRAGAMLREVAERIAEYAGSDAELQKIVDELQVFQQQAAAAPLSPEAAKEARFQSARASRGLKDYR